MLDELVQEKIAKIRSLDIERDVAVFAQQVLRSNPEPFRRIPRDRQDGGFDEMGTLLLARAQLRLILELADHAAEMLALVLDSHTSPHVRVALLGALAYLVQPDELVNDEAPGGYGYVDDCIVIKTARLAMARMGVPLELDEARELRALSLLALALAPDDFTRMQNLVTRTWNEIHLLHMMPTHVATVRAQRLYRFPLALHFDWNTPMPPITCTSPMLSHGALGGVGREGITVDFRGGGTVHMTPTGDISSYE